MSLRDKLLSAKPKEVLVTADGLDFLVVGLTKTERSTLFFDAKGQSKNIDPGKVENAFLTQCVLDPDSREQVMAGEEWDALPASITGALFAEVMRLNGLDNEDVGRVVKKSEATDTPA